MDIFDLFAKLTLDSSEYEKGLGDAQKETGSFASKLRTGLATAGKIGVAALGTVTTAAGLMSKKILDGAADVAAYGDNIDKASQKMGISAEAYQEWDAVLQHSGTSIDALNRGMITLSKQAQNNSDAFEKLGLSQEAVASMSQEDLFSAVIAGLQDMEEGTERTALAAELLGGSAKELGPLLNTSAKETEAMRKRVRDLGGVMSKDAVKAAAKYQDSLQDMQTALAGAKRGITAEFLPAITSVMDGLTEVFSGNGGSGIGMISEGIGQFVDKLSEAMPRVLEFGSKVLLSLSDAIISNLPTLISAATTTVLALANGFLEQLPQIIEVGLQVLVSLAEGIAENLPTLIPTIVDVILKIVDILTDPKNLFVMVDASIAIMIALANGLIDAVPQLIEKAPEIVMNLVDAIIENAPKLFSAARELIKKLASSISQVWSIIKDKGAELVDKLWAGIKSMFSSIADWGKKIWAKISEGLSEWWEKAKDVGRNIINGIWAGIKQAAKTILLPGMSGVADSVIDIAKSELGCHSPSTVFDQIGRYTVEGFGRGFDSEFGSVASDIEKKMASLADNSVDLSAGLTEYIPAKNGAYGAGYGSASADPILADSLDRMANTLEQILQNMGVDLVLDSGALVGHVDRILGQKATRKIRGTA